MSCAAAATGLAGSGLRRAVPGQPAIAVRREASGLVADRAATRWRCWPRSAGRGRDEIIAVLGHRGTVSRAVGDLHARSAVRRARAADLLGAVGDTTAVPQLESLLDDHDADVRRVAARALGRIGDPGLRPRPARARARSLSGARGGADPRRCAGSASPRCLRCGRPPPIRGRRCARSPSTCSGSWARCRRSPPSNGLHRDDASLEVRISAARALGRLGTRAAVAALSRSVAWPEPWQLRAVAVRALGDIGEPGVVPLLLAALDDEVYWVAHNAARALVRLGARRRRRARGGFEPARPRRSPCPGGAGLGGHRREPGDGPNEVAMLVGAPGDLVAVAAARARERGAARLRRRDPDLLRPRSTPATSR